MEFSITHWVGKKRNDNLYFCLFLDHFRPIFACKEATTVFYNFLNFFAICLEFSLTHWVGTKRNETIICIFVFFSAISNQFLLQKMPQLFFSNFLNFIAIFYEFSISRRVGTKRNDNFYFPCFSVYSNLLWLEMKPQRYF